MKTTHSFQTNTIKPTNSNAINKKILNYISKNNNMTKSTANQQANKLIFLGILLFLLGLILGLFIPLMTNPRMGLSAHLEGIINGMFLIILGLIWHKVEVTEKWLNITFWLSLYGSFSNLLAVTIGAITGAGKMMPLAGGKEGIPLVEVVISFLLISLSLAMITVCGIVLKGLYTHLKNAS
jgi:hydroxylaminobenzene mutase